MFENPDYETRQRIKRNSLLTAGRPRNDGDGSEPTKNAFNLLLESSEDFAGIAEKMNLYGHSIWGFVVYRCTYLNDAQWDEFKNFFKGQTIEALIGAGCPDDVQEALDIRFFDDKAKFDGATKAEVRTHFSEWVESPEAWAEQPHRNDIGPVFAPVKLPLWKTAPRYTHCLQVDEEALKSVIGKPVGLINYYDDIPYANLIDSTWHIPWNIMRPWEQRTTDPQTVDDRGDGAFEEEKEEEEEPIEGCTSHFVGWMKVDLRDCMPGCYNAVGMAWDAFERNYVRPPRFHDD